MLSDHIDHLFANAAGRIQRGHGLLKNHGNTIAAHFAHVHFTGGENILTRQLQPAAFDVIAVFRNEPHRQHGGDGFPRT
ncbi:hypothetical protein V462_15325 [Pantoea ananatis 15320]|nr:hypothetical protein V462_15325 [Pantoea ananatis 15320]